MTVRSSVSLRALLLACLVWMGASAGAAHAVDWQARHGLTAVQYQQTFNTLANQGYRLKGVSGYTRSGQVRYAGLWIKTAGPLWAARHGLSSAGYQAAFNDFRSKGYRLVYVNGYAVNNQPRFAAIWEKTSGPALEARHGLTAAQYQQTFDSLGQAGFRLRHVSGYSVNGQAFYAAIWDKSSGPVWTARHGLSSSEYQTAFDDLGRQGYRLKVVSGYRVGSTDRYAAIWERTSGPLGAARHGIPGDFYQGVFNNLYYQGYYPIYINGFSAGNKEKFNGIWENTSWAGRDLEIIRSKVEAYRAQYDVPGVSIALTRNGRLVYAAGFGQADESTGEEVSPDHLFRVASVSKPITAVAIMRLVEQRRLSLDQKVFGPNSLLGSEYATPSNNMKIEDITVRQLLQHVAGFTNAYGDPMFQNTSYNHDQLINWALANKVPQNDAGDVYEYSNFGYCLLGRIIEEVTGQSYETWVRNNVLSQTGVTRMVIAGNSLAERRPGEVVYYPAGAYNLNVRRFDAHGGWIATPIDLMRFMVRVDGLATKPDIIRAASHTTMTTAAGIEDAGGNDPGYAFGWGVGSGFQWHNGAMSGTLGLMARAPNGFGYAATVNTRPDGDGFAGALMQMMNEITAEISAWPAYDLF